MHVSLTVELPEEEADEALAKCSELVQALLVPPTNPDGMDEVKREQLRELAQMKDNAQMRQAGGGRGATRDFSPTGAVNGMLFLWDGDTRSNY